MNIQIFGSPKSFDSRKAERWFKERRIRYQYIDVPSKGLSPREYQSVKRKVGFDALVNTKCRAYEDLFMAYITPQAQEEKLLEHPELFHKLWEDAVIAQKDCKVVWNLCFRGQGDMPF